MTAPKIRIDIASEFKDRGFKQANKASINLDRQFKKLARTFATVFSVTAVTRFGKQAVKAFQEDEAAARRLGQTLNNLGMAFEDPFVTKFVSDVESATGVLDDQLRPAMSRLLTTTASFVKSQELLTLAIDVSRGSGVGLETVVSDLSRAYVGQTRGLTKYGTGLTAAELQTKSFTELQQILNDQFGGQSQAFLETYSGKISLLNVAYANMSETIGESLVDAMLMAAGKDGIAGLTSAMEDFGDEMADVIRGVGVLLSVLDRIPGVQGSGIAGAITSPFGLGLKALAELGKRSDKTLFFPTAGIGQPAVDKQREAIEKARIKREKELEKLRKKAAAEAAKREREARKRERDQQALKRAGTVFDMENIQIVAALQGRIDGEQRLRLVALLAINNDMAEVAEKTASAVLALNANSLAALGVTINVGDSTTDVINKLLNAQGKLALVQLGITNLPKAKNPFADWDQIIAKILADLARIQAGLQFKVGFNGLTNPPPISVNPNAPVNPNATTNLSATPSIPTTQRVSKYVDKSVCPSGEAYYDDVYVDGNLISSNFVSCVIKVNIVETPEGSGQPTIIAPNGTILSNQPATFQAGNATILSGFGGVPSTANPNDTQLMADARQRIADIFATIGVFGAGGYQPPVNVVVNVAGNVTTENDLTQNILDGLYQAQKQGNQIVYNAVAL